MVSKMKAEGRRMLSSLIMRRHYKFERIVKLGDPSVKIAEIAEELDVDMLILGHEGLGSTESNMGHVTRQVLTMTSKPVVLISK